MTLDKAIEVYEFWANTHERDAEYHRPLGYSHESTANVAEMQAREERQFAEWLKELKAYRETYPYGVEGYPPRAELNSSENPNNSKVSEKPTGSTVSKMEQVDKDINVRSKDEPKLSEIPTSKCHYEPTDEPQTSKIIEAYAKGYKDGADAVKGIKDKQIRACDICKYEIGETCTHPKVKTMKKEWATFEGDLWGEENTPKWCPIDKDEPQTDTEIAKAIVHKMIDDTVIAEDAYPDLRQKMHDAVDEYEPQTERSEE